MYMLILHIILKWVLKTDMFPVTKHNVHRSVLMNLAMMILVS